MIACEDEIRDAVEKELEAANEKNGKLASLHEAYGVMLEELEEATEELMKCNRHFQAAWVHTKNDSVFEAADEYEQIKYTAMHLAAEACQVAAVAVRACDSVLPVKSKKLAKQSLAEILEESE